MTATTRLQAIQNGRRSSLTPPHSDHPSGYNCVSAAYMHAAGAFWHGQDGLSVIRPIPGMPDVVLPRAY